MGRIALLLSLVLAACAAVAPRPDASLFAHGVASGDMHGDSAVLWTRTRESARIVPQLSRSAGFEDARELAAIETGADADFTAKAVASGLDAGTRYYYRFVAADGRASAVGTFRTPYAPGDSPAVRMAFTGDAHWAWKPYPLVDAINRENLDFFFFLGDLIYEDLDDDRVAEDLAGYRSKYRQNREPRENSASGTAPLRDLYANFGHYMVFDNHEVGVPPDKPAPPYTEGGARTAAGFVNQSPGFRDRIRAFVEYQPVRGDAARAPADPRTDRSVRFYDAIPWGANLELIILDDRSYRDVRIDVASPAAARCDRTMLGATQLAWFEDALLAAQRRGAVWKLVVISSPIQEFGNKAQVGGDLDSFKGWAGNYRCERDRVLRFIDEHAIDNVVFITTDYHFTAVNNLLYQPAPGGARKRARNAFEILTGPMGAVTGSPLRGRVPFAGLSLPDAAARVVGILNADLAKAGLDPIGLEADFPGLDAASIRAYGKPAAPGDPAAFSVIAAYSYAVLTFGPSTLQVQVKSLPYVADPGTLADAAVEREYESRRATEAVSFVVEARRAPR
jgi:phosphodiesterase/alkaline phosphatase D-like protein